MCTFIGGAPYVQSILIRDRLRKVPTKGRGNYDGKIMTVYIERVAEFLRRWNCLIYPLCLVFSCINAVDFVTDWARPIFQFDKKPPLEYEV